MFDKSNNNLTESLYHTLLVLTKNISVGTAKSDKKLCELLYKYKSLERVFSSFYNQQLFELESQKLENIEGIEKAINDIEKIDFDYNVIKICDKDYPEHLKNIPNPPPVLYTRGDIDYFKDNSIAVVGTRNLQDKTDIDEGEKIVKRLVKKGYTIVSGLALGCDSLAHRKAYQNGGKTIAVLGTSIDKSYPKENKKLQNLIGITHLVVSQYPIGIRNFPSFFAYRNNTTVGLAKDGIVIIRSGDKSGTLHAAKYCKEQNKTLYVLKNNLNHNYKWIEKYKEYEKFKIPNK